MSCYIRQYCKAHNICLWTKAQRCKLFGKLHSLSVPEAQWDVVSVDFIVELPDSHGFKATMVMVDSVSKRSHFIPTHTTVIVLGSAWLYLQNIWKLHNLPRSMLLDHRAQFTTKFMHKLYRLLRIIISVPMAYHPVWWANRADKSGAQTVHLDLHEWTSEQLGHLTTSQSGCIQ
jgi:hypothetical protein